MLTRTRADLSCFRTLLSLVAGAASLFAVNAAADVTHIVARGHTIDSIAARYHVSAKAILEANHLKNPKHLRIGEALIIPGVSAPSSSPASKGANDGSKAKHTGHEKPVVYAMRAKTPGVIHAGRLATSEEFTVRVSDRRGKVSPTSLKTFEKMMRSSSGAVHAPDPRLVALIAIVSNHFGSRKIEIISGFRPFTPTQYTAHSNHNVGKAMDFRVVGVPNEILRDYCKTLRNVGVGYYPNSTFVHLDVRDRPAFWIDYSKPGEPPRYSVANADADEGTSDVSEEPRAMTDEAAAAIRTPAPTAATPSNDNAPPTLLPRDENDSPKRIAPHMDARASSTSAAAPQTSTNAPTTPGPGASSAPSAASSAGNRPDAASQGSAATPSGPGELSHPKSP
jgi:uncharacterized protein YcbK (DUF882 family)